MPLVVSSDAHSKIEIHLSAEGLAVMDTFSKSDPFARVVLEGPGGGCRELGRTEVVANTQAPRWATGIQTDYHFEELQTLRIEVRVLLKRRGGGGKE